MKMSDNRRFQLMFSTEMMDSVKNMLRSRFSNRLMSRFPQFLYIQTESI